MFDHNGMKTRALLSVAVALLLAAATASTRMQWSTDATKELAHGCDWPGVGDIGTARTAVSHCGEACGRFLGCTHFVWSQHGSKCYFKGSSTYRHKLVLASAELLCGRMRGQPAWAVGLSHPQ